MAGFVIHKKQFYPHHGDPGPRVSFTFHTVWGVGPWLVMEEHQGIVPPERARTLLRSLHRRNLCLSWTAGVPGMFPAFSCFDYLRQMHRIRRQERNLVTFDLPREETPQETRAAVFGFIGILVFMFGGLLLWWWIDPAGLAEIANRIRERERR